MYLYVKVKKKRFADHRLFLIFFEGIYFRGWKKNPRKPRKLIPVKVNPIKVKVFKQIADQKLQLTTTFSRRFRCHFSQPSRRRQKKIFINTKDFYKQWFHHKQTLNTFEHYIFPQKFEILHYSDFFYFSVERKKRVRCKKRFTSGEKGHLRDFYVFHCFT